MKTPYGARPLHVFLEKVDGYIRKYDETKYLTFVDSEKLEKNIDIDRTRCYITLKSNISSICSYNRKIKIDSDDDLYLEQTLNIQLLVILIKSVFEENYNNYYYRVVFGKSLHE